MTESPNDWRSRREPLTSLLGRQDELKNLAAALYRRESRLITGQAGIGKTRLIQEAVSLSRQPTVCFERPRTLHRLLVDLAQFLSFPAGRFADARSATSVALKPVVLAALGTAPRCIILEDVADADPRMYRFLQQVYYVAGVSLTVSASSRPALGHLRKLLWDSRQEIALRPLNRVDSAALFHVASGRFGLNPFDVDDFGRKVLASAHGNPGQILTMCRLAARPEYHDGKHIKFLPLRMDALMGSTS